MGERQSVFLPRPSDEYHPSNFGVLLPSLCGYEVNSRRKRILDDHTKFDMSSFMLSYILSTAHSINDDMHYMDDYSDNNICRNTFRMIFQHMGQE